MTDQTQLLRAAAENALRALELPCDRWNGVQSKIVSEAIVGLRDALSAQSAQCDGGTCGLGGYCDKCPKAAQPSGGNLKCKSVQKRLAVQQPTESEEDIERAVRAAIDKFGIERFAKAMTFASETQPSGDEVGKVLLLGGDRKEVAWAKGKMPPVGTKLYTAPQPAQPAARVALTREQVKAINRAIKLCNWISEAPHQRGSVNGLAMQVAHELRGITSNGATDASN